LVTPTGTKGFDSARESLRPKTRPLVPVGVTNRYQRVFGPGSSHEPGPKVDWAFLDPPPDRFLSREAAKQRRWRSPLDLWRGEALLDLPVAVRHEATAATPRASHRHHAARLSPPPRRAPLTIAARMPLFGSPLLVRKRRRRPCLLLIRKPKVKICQKKVQKIQL
jgi:hypothetical protein